MFVARAWRVRTRPIGTQCLCVGGIMVCGPISYSPRATFRPYGTVADVERFSTNISSLRDDPLALRLCYKRSVPLGRFPTFYDCATNIPSLRDGPPNVERIFYKHSVPLGRFPRLYDCATNVPSLWDGFLFDDCATHLVPLGQVGCGSSFRAERKFWWLTSGVIR